MKNNKILDHAMGFYWASPQYTGYHEENALLPKRVMQGVALSIIRNRSCNKQMQKPTKETISEKCTFTELED